MTIPSNVRFAVDLVDVFEDDAESIGDSVGNLAAGSMGNPIRDSVNLPGLEVVWVGTCHHNNTWWTKTLKKKNYFLYWLTINNRYYSNNSEILIVDFYVKNKKKKKR